VRRAREGLRSSSQPVTDERHLSSERPLDRKAACHQQSAEQRRADDPCVCRAEQNQATRPPWIRDLKR